ncbi:cytochrome P450 [Streptomyces violascens]|uniref:cytochrome P450 n=1 Tax=Streptomyces violascens TaxID=67381 RepID=UPI00369C1994
MLLGVGEEGVEDPLEDVGHAGACRHGSYAPLVFEDLVFEHALDVADVSGFDIQVVGTEGAVVQAGVLGQLRGDLGCVVEEDVSSGFAGLGVTEPDHGVVVLDGQRDEFDAAAPEDLLVGREEQSPKYVAGTPVQVLSRPSLLRSAASCSGYPLRTVRGFLAGPRTWPWRSTRTSTLVNHRRCWPGGTARIARLPTRCWRCAGSDRAVRARILISRLVSEDEGVAGDSLDPGEFVATCELLLLAGHETTVNLIRNAIVELIQRPELCSALRDRSSLADAVVEAVLRMHPSVQFVPRIALASSTFAGHAIAEGDLRVALLAAANRDPEVFSTRHLPPRPAQRLPPGVRRGPPPLLLSRSPAGTARSRDGVDDAGGSRAPGGSGQPDVRAQQRAARTDDASSAGPVLAVEGANFDPGRFGSSSATWTAATASLPQVVGEALAEQHIFLVGARRLKLQENR